MRIFLNAPPWKNGRKVWHDSVYVLESVDHKWKLAGRLPRPIGYSVSVSIPSGLGMDPGVAYLGGSNAEGTIPIAEYFDGNKGAFIMRNSPHCRALVPTPAARS